MGWFKREPKNREELHAKWLEEHPEKRPLDVPHLLPTAEQMDELRARMEADLADWRSRQAS